LIIGLPLILRKFRKFQKLKKIFGALAVIFVPIVVFFSFALGILKIEYFQKVIFFAVTLPVLFSLFLYLILNFESFNYRQPLRSYYGFYLILFILLFIVIPIGYGSYFYDIPVFTASVPECSSPLSAFEDAAREYKLLYLMGHTKDREIFFDATVPPITIIVIDKELIQTIKVNYSQSMTNSMRDLFKMEKRNFFEENEEFQKEIMGDSENMDLEAVQSWMQQEVETPVKKKGEGNE
jgi:hypothetical protein